MGAAAASSAADESEIDGYQETPQIIFCSRTHSQLTQFVNEIKRTPFADGLRCVSLGSRKNLCVHPVVRSQCLATCRLYFCNVPLAHTQILVFSWHLQVSQLKGSGINDKCLDMQKSAGKKKSPKELEGAFVSF